jgi:hypothetical protein
MVVEDNFHTLVGAVTVLRRLAGSARPATAARPSSRDEQLDGVTVGVGVQQHPLV